MQAQVATSTLAYTPEAVYGITPAAPTFTALDRVDFTVGLTSDSLVSNTIRNDRQTSYARRGNSSTEGDLTVELTPDNYDVFLEAALQGTWTTNKLQIGNIQRSFAFEQGFDFSGGTGTEKEYRVMNGVIVNTMSMDITTDELVTATFGLMGATETPFSATPADATYTVPPAKDIFYHEDGTFSVDGIAVCYLSAISFELTNNAEITRTLGACPPSISSGKVNVTGTVTALFESTAMYNKYINNEDTILDFTLATTDQNETLHFEFHRVKFTSGTITATGEAGVTVEMGFEAIYSDTDGNTMTITRV
jgi:hypothetical protein